MVRRSRTIQISLRLLSPIRSPRSKHRALEDRGRTECRQQLVLRQAELSTENAGWRMIAPDAARALSQRPSLALRASNWFASTVSCQHPALRTIGGRPCERARPRSVGNVECRLGGRRLGHLVETGEAVQRHTQLPLGAPGCPRRIIRAQAPKTVARGHVGTCPAGSSPGTAVCCLASGGPNGKPNHDLAERA